jgi:hypothetical protein
MTSGAGVFGGGHDDTFVDVEMDSDGYMYLTGNTYSSDYAKGG